MVRKPSEIKQKISDHFQLVQFKKSYQNFKKTETDFGENNYNLKIPLRTNMYKNKLCSEPTRYLVNTNKSVKNFKFIIDAQRHPEQSNKYVPKLFKFVSIYHLYNNCLNLTPVNTVSLFDKCIYFFITRNNIHILILDVTNVYLERIFPKSSVKAEW